MTQCRFNGVVKDNPKQSRAKSWVQPWDTSKICFKLGMGVFFVSKLVSIVQEHSIIEIEIFGNSMVDKLNTSKKHTSSGEHEKGFQCHL